jgi:hypothetical protein
LHVNLAPIVLLPAARPYGCAVAVLEWNNRNLAGLAPVAKPGIVVSHALPRQYGQVTFVRIDFPEDLIEKATAAAFA